MPDMQQIEAAIGKDLSDAMNTEKSAARCLNCSRLRIFSLMIFSRLNAVLSRVETVRWHVTTLAATRLQYPASLLRFLRHNSPSGQLLRC